MPIYQFKQWESEFRSIAKADNFTLFRDHLQMLNLPNKPKLLLEGTVQAVLACCVYANIDGRPFADFLATQKYRPDNADNVKQTFTFELRGKAFARVLVSKKYASFLDLVDLYNHPWVRYKVSGYHRFWVSRTDGKALTHKENAQIEKDVTNDLRYDYAENELGFWFDDSTIEGILRVELYDVD
jgi:hypothetical protein